MISESVKPILDYYIIIFPCEILDVGHKITNKSTLDNSPPPNYDKESKDEYMI